MIPEHIGRMFALFSTTYPSWKFNEATMETWAKLLVDVEPAALLTAAAQHARTSKFHPTPAEIRDLSVSPDKLGLSPEEAWAEVMKQIRSVGWNGTPKFSSEAVKRAVSALGSWRTICSQTSNEIAANRAHFFRTYAAFAGSARRQLEYDSAREVAELVGGTRMLRGQDEMYGCDPRTLDFEDPPRAPRDSLDDDPEQEDPDEHV